MLIDLLTYTNKCNAMYIDLLIQHQSKISEKSVKLINHIINAQQIWNSRILNEPPFEVWQINDWQDLEALNNKLFYQS